MTSLTLSSPLSSSSYYSPPSLVLPCLPSCKISPSTNHLPLPILHLPSSSSVRRNPHVCRAAEYKFPDPIPEFAVAEIEKFEEHMFGKLSKKDIFGDSIPQVVGICSHILSTFLHTEYQGPGTLLVDPFIDIADTINEQGLPGGPQAARVAVKWARKYVDKDWKEWTGFDL